MNISRLNKIAALAEKGEDGERANAIAILTKVTKEKNVSYLSRPSGATEYIEYNRPRINRKCNIVLPYIEFVFKNYEYGNPDFERTEKENKIWRGVSLMAMGIIEKVTGRTCVQNWMHQITCSLDGADFSDLQSLVAAAIYDMLVGLGTPVIHYGGDKAGFSPDTDCMEDGTPDGIFQFQTCLHYEAPNRAAEIYAAMHLPEYNYFVAVAENQKQWGRITAFENDTITVTPINPKYPAQTFHLSELLHLYRVQAYPYGSLCVTPDLEPAKAAAQERMKKAYEQYGKRTKSGIFC